MGSAIAPAAASATRYLAFGDSYASGVGSGDYFSWSGACHRSPHAYPEQLKYQYPGLEQSNLTCDGAQAWNVSSPGQNDVVQTQFTQAINNGWQANPPQYITVQAGGDDANFAGVMSDCANPFVSRTQCDNDIGNAVNFINSSSSDGHQALSPRLNVLYWWLRYYWPSPQVDVVLYPQLFNGQTCGYAYNETGSTGAITPYEEGQIRYAIDRVDDITTAYANAYGFHVVDPRANVPGESWTGHEICTGFPYVLGVIYSPTWESFHPNINGQNTYDSWLRHDLWPFMY